jgi:hypothetical protein
MAFETRYPKRKDWRRPYRRRAQQDLKSCRPHGGCPWCESNRQIRLHRELGRTDESIREWEGGGLDDPLSLPARVSHMGYVTLVPINNASMTIRWMGQNYWAELRARRVPFYGTGPSVQAAVEAVWKAVKDEPRQSRTHPGNRARVSASLRASRTPQTKT